MNFKYKLERLPCGMCGDITDNGCPYGVCPYILDTLTDLVHDPAFHEAMMNADDCESYYRPTLLLLKNAGIPDDCVNFSITSLCVSRIQVLSHSRISGSHVLADKGYYSDQILEFIYEHDAWPTIPPRANRSEQRLCDWWLYKERHLVECFFRNSRIFAESLPDMTSWLIPSLALFVSPPSAF